MIATTIFRALERQGVDRYTLATCAGRAPARHHQAILEAVVILIVFLLVLLCAGTVVGAQAAATEPAAKSACAEKHEAAAADITALRTTILAARASNDTATLRAALDATLAHLDAMEGKAAKCAGMMKDHMVKPSTPKAEAPAKHDH